MERTTSRLGMAVGVLVALAYSFRVDFEHSYLLLL
jgi:hypothetical protein